MSLASIKRGDTVWHVRNGWRRGDTPVCGFVEVTAAGPKYIAVGRDRFHREDGKHVTAYTAIQWIYATREDYEAKVARDQLEGRAARLIRDVRTHALSDTQLHELVALLEPPA